MHQLLCVLLDPSFQLAQIRLALGAPNSSPLVASNPHDSPWIYKPQLLEGSLPATPPRYQYPASANMPCEADLPSSLPPRTQQIGHRLTKSLDMQFWANIYSMEITSNECLSKVQSLLSCPSKIAAARSFQGDEAQTFIDFLDRVSKWHARCFDD